jgi:hypothetical protein
MPILKALSKSISTALFVAEPACKFPVAEPGSTENIQGAAYGEINIAGTQLFDQADIFPGMDAPGVSDGDTVPTCQTLKQRDFHTPALSFNIHSMNQIFMAIAAEFVQQGFIDGFSGKRLPAVRHNIIVLTFAPAAQIQDKALFADSLFEPFQSGCIDQAVMKDPGCDNYSRGPGIQPILCIVQINASTQLEAARPGCQRLFGSLLIARSQLDDMPAVEPILPVEPGKPFSRLPGLKIYFQVIDGIIVQSISDNLLDLPLVQVDTGTKSHVCNAPKLSSAKETTTLYGPAGSSLQ